MLGGPAPRQARLERPMRIARLTASDLEPYRALMLRAYADTPDAFTSTAEERAAEPPSWWLKRIADPAGLHVAFGGFDGDTLVATVALEFTSRPKVRHKALLIGMVVAAAARRRGVGRALLDAALAHCWARGGIRAVTLTVTQGNEAALALYRGAGFRPFGVEPMAIRTAAGYLSKVHMQLLAPAESEG